MDTPIVFLIFNRPDTTLRVFEAIRKARPRHLLVVADGPRTDREQDHELVTASRKIIDSVDWPCEILTNYAIDNLGCKERVASGLDWAFSLFERLIILEDDCLPDPSFFPFCESLLARYADDERVMMISGDNFQNNQNLKADQPSYYFSRWSHIWGWASWRRAWQHFDVNVTSWPDTKEAGSLRPRFGSDEEYNHWATTLDRQHAGLIDTWDFPWQYACWERNGLTILPRKNLISNIGFREDATHTLDSMSKLANLPVDAIGELVHPQVVQPDNVADQITWESIFRPPPIAPIKKRKRWYQRLFSGQT